MRHQPVRTAKTAVTEHRDQVGIKAWLICSVQLRIRLLCSQISLKSLLLDWI